ncbi:hypothetical protein CONPUDRAFT_168960 [Coniophora puteana RWD-64-598 SS2]|uniref:F-box domain-containing protein n=1 Tax=Coniophora puteana (strain RWD-64-598) TaxID=741705 RepID=A0A5M3MBI4_CONPW|nr:uncharacterized protein CONPUDRAFT_168960 [Coniophora puteana RWD-64-598 SS2]EIW76417.1 hypothetical protein CONPUDRAFT_168960 [Coniophora puteana RWD-64-598 SS2]
MTNDTSPEHTEKNPKANIESIPAEDLCHTTLPSASITSMPTELLYVILHLVECPSGTELVMSPFGSFELESIRTYAETLTLTGKLALPHVCRRWMEVLAPDPEFWKVLAVRLDDSSPFTPAFIHLFFDASRGNLFAVEISVGNPDIAGMTAAEENSRIETILEVLRPYFPRIMSLKIRTVFRSSAIIAINGLDTRALSLLITLHLDSHIADDPAPLFIGNIEFSKLSHLQIDAKSFVHLINCGLYFPSDRVETVDITRYRPANGSFLSTLAFVKALHRYFVKPNMTLSISDVAFDPLLSSKAMTWPPSCISVHGLHLRDLDGPSVSAILRHVGCVAETGSVTLERCELDPQHREITQAANVTLIETGQDPALEPIIQN